MKKKYLLVIFTGVLCLFFCTLSLYCGEAEKKTTFEAIVTAGMKQIPEKYKTWLEMQDLAPLPNCKEIHKQLTAISKNIKMTADVGARPENILKNLHPYVLPFDETRTLRDKKGFYISANDVLSPHQAYIVGQAPTEETVQDFWTTVLETNTRLIVALAMPHGEGTVWLPYFERERFPIKIGEWLIEFGDEQVMAVSAADPLQRIIQRTLLAKKGEEVRTFAHLHYERWKDFGAPELDLFQKLLSLLSNGEEHPILVHCSAGQGRSGTLVVADSLLKDIKKSSSASPSRINIPKRIIEFRFQRKGLVSTVVQLEAIYKVLENTSAIK